ncbi:hypothetical protein FSARC_14039 [Fusarium sarcochroum]|uniref:Uncharacterized protein n=1 Tax=Fusarium sarcochroum TaxID=1208366 RepID=A0A8H4WRG9_9HYPO|nr:hypothetical protein FSARC_14039 [Fusarium sarcochroum]
MADEASSVNSWIALLAPLEAEKELHFDLPFESQLSQSGPAPEETSMCLFDVALEGRNLDPPDNPEDSWYQPQSPSLSSHETDTSGLQAQLAFIVRPRGNHTTKSERQRGASDSQKDFMQPPDDVVTSPRNYNIKSSLVHVSGKSIDNMPNDSASETPVTGEGRSSQSSAVSSMNLETISVLSTSSVTKNLPRKIRNWYMSAQERLVVEVSSRCAHDMEVNLPRTRSPGMRVMQVHDDVYLDDYHAYLQQRYTSIMDGTGDEEFDVLRVPDDAAIRAALRSVGYTSMGVTKDSII